MSVYDNNRPGHPPDDNENSTRLLATTTAAYLTIYVAPAMTNLTWPLAEVLLVDAYGYEVREVGFWLHTAAIFVASFAVLKLLLRGAIFLVVTATGKWSWDLMSGSIPLPF